VVENRLKVKQEFELEVYTDRNGKKGSRTLGLRLGEGRNKKNWGVFGWGGAGGRKGGSTTRTYSQKTREMDRDGGKT